MNLSKSKLFIQMTTLRKGAVIKSVKDITIGATLSLLLLNSSMVLQSCGDGDESDQSNQEEEAYKARPVVTYITETSKGEFKITDEIPVDSDAQAGAVVRYEDGRRDTLTVAQAQQLVKTDSTTKDYHNNPNQYHSRPHHRNSLSNALLWGGIGYMMGRNRSPQQYNETRERQYSSSAYINKETYAKSSAVHEGYHSHRRSMASRPSSSRGGFFSRGGRSFGG
jgi:hypothetical protein